VLTSHHLEIRGRFRAVDAEQMRRARCCRSLRIRDVERPVQAKPQGTQADDRHARRRDFDVSLEAFA
jgi:hypothetical protein